jgi:hypothetical protein
VLLGVLVGSVIGLWPFTQSVGEKALEARSFEEVARYAGKWQVPGVEGIDDKAALIEYLTRGEVWSRRTAPPIALRDAATALVLVLVGFVATGLLSRTGSRAGAEVRSPARRSTVLPG